MTDRGSKGKAVFNYNQQLIYSIRLQTLLS